VSWQLGTLLLALLFGEPGGTAEQAVLALELAPALRCPAPSAITAALEARWPTLSGESGSDTRARFRLRVEAHGTQGVTLRLFEGEALLVERSLEVAAHECNRLADTIALIAESWIAVPSNAAPPQAEQPAPPSASVHDLSSAVSRDVMPDTSSEPAAAKNAAAPAAARVTSAPPATAMGHAPRTVHDRTPTHALDQLTLAASAGAVLAFDAGAAASAAVGAAIEAAKRRFRFGLRGHFESARSLDDQDAISLRHTPLELYVGGVLGSTARVDVDLLLGGGLDVVSAQVSSYEQSGTSRSLAPLVTLSLRTHWHPRPAFSLFAAADLVLNLRRERFVSEGETLATTLWPRVRFALGASWHLF
jgi:hypothetical protein